MTSDGIYFDPSRGWVTPADEYQSDSCGNLKEIAAALKRADQLGTEPPDDLCDAVEHLLYRYLGLVRHGVREDFGESHSGVSWNVIADPERERALISFQEGRGEWAEDCYADEVPRWLLIGLLRRIRRRKPLGDQQADEIIARVDHLDAEYEQLRQQPSRLNVMPPRAGDV